MSLLSTQPYKGTRDFFPDEMRSRQWMFTSLQKTVEKFGYEKYDAPLLEPLDIYLAKTSEEIVGQQIYSFTDRGGRQVAIRPEMTPTVSRMVAARSRELPRPIRWYSIPNLWRYERPGKGRLREHWQLNCDLFATQDELGADIEILSMAAQILIDFGAGKEQFQILLNHREIINAVFETMLQLPLEQWANVARIMDKKEKVSAEAYHQMLLDEGLQSKKIALLDSFLNDKEEFLKQHWQVFETKGGGHLQKVIQILNEIGYGDFIEYSPSVVRGFDYYTGSVFEVFDKHPENRRSLFGGGRYNHLVSNFTNDQINAVGFGMGDVTLENFLKTHELYQQFSSVTQIWLVWFEQEYLALQNQRLAKQLRESGFLVETSLSKAKLGQQFKIANQKKIPWVVICGEDEFQKQMVSIKNLDSGEQQEIAWDNLVAFFKNQ